MNLTKSERLLNAIEQATSSELPVVIDEIIIGRTVHRLIWMPEQKQFHIGPDNIEYPIPNHNPMYVPSLFTEKLIYRSDEEGFFRKVLIKWESFLDGAEALNRKAVNYKDHVTIMSVFNDIEKSPKVIHAWENKTDVIDTDGRPLHIEVNPKEFTMCIFYYTEDGQRVNYSIFEASKFSRILTPSEMIFRLAKELTTYRSIYVAA